MVLDAVSAGGGLMLLFGEASPVYNGASPSDESLEPSKNMPEVSW